MKKEIRKFNPIDVELRFPIAGKLDGWYFKIEEISNGAYQVSGSDFFGRIVSKTGGDPDVTLVECIKKATEIQSQIEK
ncbi:hypothetical protein GYB29_05805 [bacterium]|jgi:hypothetical protein|nr:hypothetical protein [bacterium]